MLSFLHVVMVCLTLSCTSSLVLPLAVNLTPKYTADFSLGMGSPLGKRPILDEEATRTNPTPRLAYPDFVYMEEYDQAEAMPYKTADNCWDQSHAKKLGQLWCQSFHMIGEVPMHMAMHTHTHTKYTSGRPPRPSSTYVY